VPAEGVERIRSAMIPMVSELLDGLLLAAAPEGGKLGLVDSVVKFFKDGGPFMFVNLFWLAAALAVVGERIYTLMFRYNLNAPPFMEQISKLVQTGNVDRAVKLCAAAPNSPLAKVIRAGLSRANRGEIEVAKAVEESVVEHSPHVTARIPWLWSLANIATLVGLVGTIFGLIGTFQALGNVPAEQKQTLLSDGISKAMNNTAFALSIAVLCIVFHLFLTSYAKAMVETVELNALKLENLLSRRHATDTQVDGEPRAA
jgi:biopolymer transport protein ExbB/TolQ